MAEARTALVTGSTGFVGRHLVTALADAGWLVHVIVRPGSDALAVEEIRGRASLYEVDGSLESVMQAVVAAQPTHCFHLAGVFVGSHAPADVPDLIRSNVEFPTYLAEALAGRGCRLVNVGTIWQNHDGRDYGPASLYAATKQAFQDVLQFYGECGTLDAVTVKLCDTYGSGDTRGKLVDLLLGSARSGEPVDLSAGDQLIDLVHVEDAVAALLAAADARPSEVAPAYRVGSPELLTLRELVEEIEHLLGRTLPVRWGRRPYRLREMFTPWGIDPIVPGWQVRIPLARGISELWAASAERQNLVVARARQVEECE